VATTHDLADGFHLLNTPGWATLLAILQESGERPPKRTFPFSHDSASSIYHPYPKPNAIENPNANPGSPAADAEQLAKRFKGASLD